MKIQYRVGGNLNEIEFDATVQESHTSSATVTERNVEKGANVTDHVRPSQDKINVEAVVSNTPLRTPATNADGARGNIGQVAANTFTLDRTSATLARQGKVDRNVVNSNASVLQFDKEFDRVRNVYEELVKIVSTPILVHIDTLIRTYEDMVITSLSAPRAVEDSIHFSFEAVHVRFVESKTIQIKAADTGRTNVGHKPPKEAKEDAPPQSILREDVVAPIKGAFGL